MEGAHPIHQAYENDPEPNAPFAALAATFLVLVGSGLALAFRRDRLPERIGAFDLFLLGVATFHLARTVSKDEIARFIRAPFTEIEEATGLSELNERPRRGGAREAIGKLLACPFCLGQWVAGGFTVGFVLAPRFTRVVTAIFSVSAFQDVLQLGYDSLKQAYQS